MDELKLSPDLALPANAVTQRLAFIARTGAGKSYAASKLAEEMLSAGSQIVVLDPVGNWYGLRLAPDGKKPSAFSLPVLGGLHGDIALEPGAGALIADLVVDRGLSVILDVSLFRKGQRKQFATDFAEQFFHRKKSTRSAVHIFVEEAQVFIPQKAQKGEERMLGAFEDLVRLGRNYGIGATLITQRPQSVNKEVLNMTEALFVLQVNGAQERDALMKWIIEKRIESREVVDALPSLPVGTAYVWSPQWLKVLQKVKIARKRTYDASATPEPGAAVAEPGQLSPVDLVALEESMRTVIELAKANDPTALKAEVGKLKRELAAARSAQPAPAPAKVERIEVPVLEQGAAVALLEAVRQLAAVAEHIQQTVPPLRKMADDIAAAVRQADEMKRRGTGPGPKPASQQKPNVGLLRTPARPARRPIPAQESAPAGDVAVSRPQQAILDALAWLESVGLAPADKVQLALLSGASPKSSAYGNNLGALRTAGLIVYPAGGRVALSDEGRAVANVPVAPPTADDLQRDVLARLPRPQAAILSALIVEYPHPMSKNDLATLAGASATSSAFGNNLGALRSLKLIDYPSPGQVVARPVLFLEE